MGVTFIAKEGTYTAPATLTTKTITENGTYSAVDDSANGYSSVTVEVEGGGGSSDFSTATMRIVNNLQNTGVSVRVAYIVNDGIEVGASIGEGVSSDKTVVLYKNLGTALILDDAGEPVNMSASGNATIEDDVFVIYTGNCTITIS